MAAIQTIYWPVPEGFPAMSLPVNPATRFKDDDIILSPATESDLMHIADGLYKGFFPKSWWDHFEPPALQPSAEVRKIRLTERFKPLLTQDQNFRFIVAKIAGEFAGCAGWHIPGKEWRGSMMLCDVPKNKVEVGWNSGQSVDTEIWTNVDVEKWAETWKRFEDIRREIMGEEPHWYLQPFIVLEKFRGRGIGRKLLDYAIERADAEDLPSTIYLEAFPNARPVYLHVGFKPVEGQENALVFRSSLGK